MDTLILLTNRTTKAVSNTVGLLLILGLLIGQNLLISAQESGFNTGISPTVNYIKDREREIYLNFNKEIEEKYLNFEKQEVEKGIHHIKLTKYYNNQPVKINIVELSTDVNSNLNIEPAIASNTLNNKNKISSIAKRENAIIAINGGYFKPQTGVPLGTLMIDKKIYTGPIYNRVAMGFFDNSYKMARIDLNGNIDTNIGGFKIDNVNQPRMLSTHTIVYTSDWGEASPPTPKYGTQLVISKGKLVAVSSSSTEIPKDGFVIVGPTKKLEPMLKAKKFRLDLKTSPEWKNVNHIISGGPYLVKNGEIFVDMTAQKLASIGGRNPRTAIGYTKDNHLIMLTADGREESSVGLTLIELANLMKDFGCVDAMNLDGGGSTVMYVDGKVVNKPAMSGGIPLSHTLIVSYKDYS